MWRRPYPEKEFQHRSKKYRAKYMAALKQLFSTTDSEKTREVDHGDEESVSTESAGAEGRP